MVLVEAKVIDSTHLELMRPIIAVRGGIVSLTLAESGEEDPERDRWLAASSAALGAAYGESEPDYPPSLIRQTNPDYRA